jgi:hypothetical protein
MNEFYMCAVTLQNPAGALLTFHTFAIALSVNEAIVIARDKASRAFPREWGIVGTFAGAVERTLLEEIAETVLEWKRP